MKYLSVLLLCLTVSACAVTRVTTTKRTAVEEALITKSITTSIRSLEIENGNDRSIYIDTNSIEECDAAICGLDRYTRYLVYSLKETLLQKGFHVSDNKETADLVAHIKLDYAAIDDGETLVGLPSIPIPIPGVGTVGTPEIALFSKTTQYGRVRFSLHAVENKEKTDKLVFSNQSKAAETYYSRWTVLLIFGFKTTDLAKPF